LSQPGADLDPRQWAAARVWVAARMPYLATALLAMPVLARPGIGTVAVDPAWLAYADPEVVAEWDAATLGRVIVHLVSHLLRDHGVRAGEQGVTDETAGRWTLAADAEINDDLLTVDALPDQAPDVAQEWGQAAGGLAEQYNAHLSDHPAHRRGTLDCGSGCDGQTRDWDGGAPPPAWLRRLVQIQTAQAVSEQARREPGTVPAGLARWAERLLRPTVDWRRVLAAEIRRAVASVAGLVDYSYQRPSRRASAVVGVVLPTLRHPIPELAVVCDTSGSMSEDLLARALTEIDGLVKAIGGRRGVPVLACDTAVHAVTRVTTGAHLQLAGGGGTDMGAGIATALARRPRPDVIVVLTDGYTPWPERPPPARVVVGLIRPGQAGGRAGQAGGRAVVADWQPPGWARTVVISEAG
jgi:predicted metal-dependent peptidase